MAKQEIIAALDLGSSQMVAVLGSKDENERIKIISAGRVRCRGLKGGVVVSIEETVEAITEVVEQAEKAANTDVRSLYVAIRGGHIESFNHRGATNISRSDKEITAEDVATVLEAAKAVQVSSDREIIHTLAQDFSIDRQAGVNNPVGMEGIHLGVDVHIVTASTSHLNNIYKCINRAGFTIDDVVLGVLAVGEVVVTPEEKELGALLIDIGGDTINLAIYVKGAAHYTKELPLGGESITRDLAYGLRTSSAVAREIKEKHGAAMLAYLEGKDKGSEEVRYLSVDGRNERSINRKTVCEIIQPRTEEIFTLVNEQVQNSGYAEEIPAGAILTGGGSLLKGITYAVEEILNMPARLGLSQGIESGTPEITLDPAYATACGVLKYTLAEKIGTGGKYRKKATLGKKLRRWVDEFF